MAVLFGIPLVGSLFYPVLLVLIVFVAFSYLSPRKYSENVLGPEDLITKNNELNCVRENLEEQLQKPAPKKIKKKICSKKGGKCCSKKKQNSCQNFLGSIESVIVFYTTVTGNSKAFASQLCDRIKAAKNTSVKVVDLASYDPEDNLVNECTGNILSVFLLPTHNEGKPPEGGSWFYTWLEEAVNDFRLSRGILKDMKYAVFGLGNSQYGENYNVVAKNVDKWLHKLQACRVLRLGLGDENSKSQKWTMQEDFLHWSQVLINRLEKWQLEFKTESKGCNCVSEDCDHEKEMESSCDSEGSDESSDEKEDSDTSVVDLEELGPIISNQKSGDVINKIHAVDEQAEMITPLLRSSLMKQGYRLIGTHSGVKLCRWTKSMLRGRGGCYKHTFYGIESHQCMETTPSLACANKCVFCWRHHSNPVGTEWRWKMDPPELILETALEQHYKMINQFKGVPGVIPERLKEGLRARHCALSLVGEPIMYPEINEFVKLLHQKRISSFLVTNAQFPDAIRNMGPVTQLYVSVDAASKESLKKIDRPLFRDFWERFVDSLRALEEKGQRTVYRLTLVKAWNTAEIDGYAQLVELGKPDFIEVKGVTYCGTSKASNLTMENVPWHEEVVNFVQKLADRLKDYEIAAEHEHSNCVLIAHTKFKVNGTWHTWIDYEKFHQLVNVFYESNGTANFTALDYMHPTPEWAVYGAVERGFDPIEQRWHRKNVKKDISGC
ncbi:S-adenosyl-L-methionine-dependent tRNA 4-demethylwyosine synthase TYW1-like [Schistocerca gregaria]|uniref:S-adenosyl-L-methionine-dependent tRNA 4-demethylwyosine synthase TYW1-like n=1 Tax=Schistocerca gregaria TaxID=7010 RepID=UPI00211DA950|nr:S-adenosyl-L-methionine-dependent tRNA 4-demethylwyosine synthase TYW1-like [Schistocerca gregaria]